MILFGAFCNPSRIFSQEISTSQEILIKAILAYGGEYNLREQENYTLQAYLYSSTGELLGMSVFYFKKPGKILQEIYLISQDRFIRRIYNDGKVFISQNDKEVENVVQIARFRKKSRLRIKTGLFPLLYLLDHREEVNYIGEKLINGKKCLGLETLIDKDVKDTYFFDSRTFLILKSIRTISFPNKSATTIVHYDDFEKVNKIIFPFHMERYQDDIGSIEMRVDKISFAKLDDNLFIIE